MNIKKILFISYDGMTDPLGQSQVIPYLGGLTKHGYQFTILSCDKPEKYKSGKAYVEKLMQPFGIKWISVPYHKNPPVFSSIYDLIQLKRKAKEIYQHEKFDMVHTRVGLPVLVALWLKKKYKVKFLNDIRGFWADERVDGGIWKLQNPLYRLIYHFFKKKEFKALEAADYNICLTNAGMQEITSWKNIEKQPIPIEVIPCSVDLVLFDPEKIDTALKNEFKKELHIDDGDFIISYLGSIGGWYLTNEMMRFCKIMSDKIPTAKFLFITPDINNIIYNAAVACGLSSDKLIIKHARRHEVPALLSFSSYSLFFIKPCYSKKASSPTKHGEIMAMGIPVITNAGVGDMEAIVIKYNGGYVLHDFSTASFTTVVDKIQKGDSFDKTIIRNGAKDYYALERAVASYKKVYAIINQ
jgi:glycosyltransferase involved in cell wall biosynthesis